MYDYVWLCLLIHGSSAPMLTQLVWSLHPLAHTAYKSLCAEWFMHCSCVHCQWQLAIQLSLKTWFPCWHCCLLLMSDELCWQIMWRLPIIVIVQLHNSLPLIPTPPLIMAVNIGSEQSQSWFTCLRLTQSKKFQKRGRHQWPLMIKRVHWKRIDLWHYLKYVIKVCVEYNQILSLLHSF